MAWKSNKSKQILTLWLAKTLRKNVFTLQKHQKTSQYFLLEQVLDKHHVDVQWNDGSACKRVKLSDLFWTNRSEGSWCLRMFCNLQLFSFLQHFLLACGNLVKLYSWFSLPHLGQFSISLSLSHVWSKSGASPVKKESPITPLSWYGVAPLVSSRSNPHLMARFLVRTFQFQCGPNSDSCHWHFHIY